MALELIGRIVKFRVKESLSRKTDKKWNSC